MRGALIIILLLILSLIFVAYPSLDLTISSIFYDSKIGFKNREYFLDHGDLLMLFLDYAPIFLLPFIFIIWIGGWIISIYLKTKSMHYKNYISVTYVILSILIGPVILVQLSKNHFARARPDSIIEFGGEKNFTSAFAIGKQCRENCSFVSAHVGASCMFIPFTFLINNDRKRRLALSFIIILSTIVGIMRVKFGRHFLSDVVVAGFLVYIVSYIMAVLFDLRSVKRNNEHN